MEVVDRAAVSVTTLNHRLAPVSSIVNHVRLWPHFYTLEWVVTVRGGGLKTRGCGEKVRLFLAAVIARCWGDGEEECAC